MPLSRITTKTATRQADPGAAPDRAQPVAAIGDPPVARERDQPEAAARRSGRVATPSAAGADEPGAGRARGSSVSDDRTRPTSQATRRGAEQHEAEPAVPRRPSGPRRRSQCAARAARPALQLRPGSARARGRASSARSSSDGTSGSCCVVRAGRRQRRVALAIRAGRRCASRRGSRRRRPRPSRRRRGGSRAGRCRGRPSASSAARKIAGCGLIVPTRCETTIARRYGRQPCASANRSIVDARAASSRGSRARSPRPARPLERGRRVRRPAASARRTRRCRPRRRRRPRRARRARRRPRRPSARPAAAAPCRAAGRGRGRRAGAMSASRNSRDLLAELPLALLRPGGQERRRSSTMPAPLERDRRSPRRRAQARPVDPDERVAEVERDRGDRDATRSRHAQRAALDGQMSRNGQ